MFLIRGSEAVSVRRTPNFCRLSKKGGTPCLLRNIWILAYHRPQCATKPLHLAFKLPGQMLFNLTLPNCLSSSPRPSTSRCRQHTAKSQNSFELAAFVTFNGLQIAVQSISSALEKIPSMHHQSRPRGSSSIVMNAQFPSPRLGQEKTSYSLLSTPSSAVFSAPLHGITTVRSQSKVAFAAEIQH